MGGGQPSEFSDAVALPHNSSFSRAQQLASRCYFTMMKFWALGAGERPPSTRHDPNRLEGDGQRCHEFGCCRVLQSFRMFCPTIRCFLVHSSLLRDTLFSILWRF